MKTKIAQIKREIATAKALRNLKYSDSEIGKMLKIAPSTATARHNGESNQLVIKMRAKDLRDNRVVTLGKKNWTLTRIGKKVGLSHVQVRTILDQSK
jgi:hypothetical protein